MRLCISARGVVLEDPSRGALEQRLRLLLGGWACRIRQAKVFIEDVNGPKGGLDLRCTIEAVLTASGTVTVRARGTDAEMVLRSAARRLVRRVKREFCRRRFGVRAGDLFDAGSLHSGERSLQANR
jgi:hypothetical protein